MINDKFPHTVVQCLTAIAQHHGLQINPERLIDDYALTAEEPKDNLIIRMAGEIGLKAKIATISWENLLEQNGVFPLMARMKMAVL